MTELATIDDTTTTTTDLIPGQVGFNSAQKAMLAQLGLADAPEGDLILFSHVCQKSGLDPFRREIYMIGRNTQVAKYVPNASGEGQHKEVKWETVYTIQTGIQGFRKRAREIADSKGDKLGFNGPYWCGDDGEWKEVWPEKTPPVAAKYIVFRNGEPIPAVCHYTEYVQEVGTGADRKPNSMWSSMPRNQIAKCAEAQALQRAYPDELSGLLLEDAAVQTINEDGTDAAPSKAARRGGKGVGGLADRARAESTAGASVDAGPDTYINCEFVGGNDQTAEPPAGATSGDDSGDQDTPPEKQKTAMRRAVEKRMFGLIGKIEPDVSRDDRMLIYRSIIGRKDINSTDDLDDAEVAAVGDQLYKWLEAGSINNKVRDIVNEATLAEENQKEQS